MSGDAFAYLEDNRSDRARSWVASHSQRTKATLARDPRFQQFHDAAYASEAAARAAGNLAELMGYASLYDGWVYQLSSSTSHPRGLWRRTALTSFTEQAQKWETLLDVDALSAHEGRDWRFVGAYPLPDRTRWLVRLSVASSLTYVWREFDIRRRAFLADGFVVPESFNSHVAWLDNDTLLVNADFGPGSVSSENHNSIVVKKWSRGERLQDAPEIFRGERDDRYVLMDEFAAQISDPGEHGDRFVTFQRLDGADRSTWWRADRKGRVERLTLPTHQTFPPILFEGRHLVLLREDWEIGGRIWKASSLLAIPAAEAVKAAPRIELVMEPAADRTIGLVQNTSAGVLIFGSQVGQGRMWIARRRSEQWSVQAAALPDGTVMPALADVRFPTAYVVHEGYLDPPTLYAIDVHKNRAVATIRSPVQFDGRSYVTERLEARSPDSTLVPYVVVRRRDLRLDGRAPLLIRGYGAHGGSMTPQYSAALGKLWLEGGGVYVFAHVRGGTERGREWWVRRGDRRRTYEDMVAVVEDLIRRGVTSPKRVGIIGHSSGGLLAGVMLTQRPDLFGAAVIKAAPLDLFRMDLTAQGAAFSAAEFGSPDIPEDRAFLERTSPLQALRFAANFPEPLLMTSTSDQTVHPAHTRSFAAKMESLGMPFLFYESAEGGHGVASTAEARAQDDALVYTYLAQKLLGRIDQSDGRGRRHADELR